MSAKINVVKIESDHGKDKDVLTKETRAYELQKEQPETPKNTSALVVGHIAGTILITVLTFCLSAISIGFTIFLFRFWGLIG